jgi:hypothetical protein
MKIFFFSKRTRLGTRGIVTHDRRNAQWSHSSVHSLFSPNYLCMYAMCLTRKKSYLLDTKVLQGPIFRTFFSAENHFPRKIPRNFLEKRFFKTCFRGKFHFFPTFWGGKFSAEFSLKFSPEKNVRKIDPRVR